MTKVKEIKVGEFVIHQGCKTYGIVRRDGLNLNLCRDPECGSCRTIHEAIKAEAENYTITNKLKHGKDC